jgi:hypothetical protein
MVERNGLDDVTGRGQGRLTDVRVTGTMDSLEERKIGMTKDVDECHAPCTLTTFGWNTSPAVSGKRLSQILHSLWISPPSLAYCRYSLLFHRRAGHGHNFPSLQSHPYFGCQRFFPTLIHVPPSHSCRPSHHVDLSCVGLCVQTRPPHPEASCACPFPASIALRVLSLMSG